MDVLKLEISENYSLYEYLYPLTLQSFKKVHLLRNKFIDHVRDIRDFYYLFIVHSKANQYFLLLSSKPQTELFCDIWLMIIFQIFQEGAKMSMDLRTMIQTDVQELKTRISSLRYANAKATPKLRVHGFGLKGNILV